MEKTFVASTWVVKARNASRETQWTRLDFFIVSGSNILFKKSVDLKQGWEAAGGEAATRGRHAWPFNMLRYKVFVTQILLDLRMEVKTWARNGCAFHPNIKFRDFSSRPWYSTIDASRDGKMYPRLKAMLRKRTEICVVFSKPSTQMLTE